MFNLDQIQSHLKSPAVTDQILIHYVQNPNGQVPSVLALAELKRRQELRAAPQDQAQRMIQPTVADKVISQDVRANIGPDFRSQGLPAVDQQLQAQQSMGQGISNLPVREDMYNEKNYAGGGIVAFDDGGDVNLSTHSQFMPLTNEEKQMLAAKYLVGADLGNNKGAAGIDYAGSIDSRGVANPRLQNVHGRYMTDQGVQYSGMVDPTERRLSVDRQEGRTSVGADVAPGGVDNRMGLRSIHGDYMADDGARYGAQYNVDPKELLLERISREGNSLGLTASPDSVGIRGAYNFAQGGAVGYAPGGIVYGIDEDTYNTLSPQDQAIVQADYAKKDAIRPRSFTKDISSVIQTMTNLPSAIASKFAGTGLKAGQNLAESYGYAPSAENKAYVQNFNSPNYIPRATELPVKEEEDAKKQEDLKDAAAKAGIKEPGFVGSTPTPVKGLGEYASELEAYMGPDKSREGRDARLAKMEARAKDMEDKNVGMSMLTAGLDIAGGTSPYALVNLARGKSGIEQYQKTQDKLAELEEKRYALITEAERADRQEKFAYAKYGAEAKKTKEAEAHAEKMQNNLLKNEWAMTKYKTEAEIYKTNLTAAAKGVPTIEERLKVREKVPDLMVTEEKKILDKIGGDSNNPKSPNHPLYLDLMAKARARLESEMIAPLGKPQFNSSAWGNLKVSK
jgi:hypothetical protein